MLYNARLHRTGVAELVDALDLGSSGAAVSSSLLTGTIRSVVALVLAGAAVAGILNNDVS